MEIIISEMLIPLLVIYSKDAASYHKNSVLTMCSFIGNSQKLETKQCPTTEKWIVIIWYIYTTEYYSAIKNNDIMEFVGKTQTKKGQMWHGLISIY